MSAPWKIQDPWCTCFTCQHYEPNGPSYVSCRQSGRLIVRLAAQGCAYWIREVGSDDDLGPLVREYLIAEGQDPDAVVNISRT